jgi:hypothetical protein
MRQSSQVAGLAPLTQHLFDKESADAELLGHFSNRAFALLISLDDSLT